VILPKAATRQKPEAKKSKASANGNGIPADNTAAKSGGIDLAQIELEKSEYLQRKASQLESIKRTDKKLLKEMLYQMVLGRIFEEKCAEVYRMGKIGGFCHLYIGQEAIGVGSMMALKPTDMVITSYRDHVQAMIKGLSPESVMAELYGKEGGCVGGKGGSMHMFSKEHEFYGGHGIVGAQVSLGTGLAFANKYRDNGNVSLTFFGDGAANQGQVYESFNMASLWKLPVIYVIENNRYAMGTSVTRSSAETDFSHRGISFRIPGIQVDGMDVRGPARGRSSSKCSPTAIAAIRCPTRRNTARRTRSRRCVPNTIRSSR
jgi:TPP-dependent pyruvate/acetoin dehydrogenase alpha subunit